MHCGQYALWAVCIVCSMHCGQYALCAVLQYAVLCRATVCRSVQYALCAVLQYALAVLRAPAITLLRQFKNCFCE